MPTALNILLRDKLGLPWPKGMGKKKKKSKLVPNRKRRRIASAKKKSTKS
jgi:hypothetical protein